MRVMQARQLTAALLVALPLVATAAEESKRPGFEEADANGDGTITVKEATSAGVPEAEAKREDIDNDGELTKADWKFVDMEGMKKDGDSGSGDSGSSGEGSNDG